MVKMKKTLYIIAGCNGAGKTTASFSILPEILNCKEFINADEIAKGLSPFQPETVAINAGKIMINRIDDLILSEVNFAFETTLSSKSYQSKIKFAQKHKYKVILLFFWLDNVNLAIERVKQRVDEGGHCIANDVIKRRYFRGIKNLFEIYMPIVDETMIFDNSEGNHELIAVKSIDNQIKIINNNKFEILMNYYESI